MASESQSPLSRTNSGREFCDKVTYGLDASPEKIKKESGKYPPQTELGFRLVGMKVCSSSSSGCSGR